MRRFLVTVATAAITSWIGVYLAHWLNREILAYQWSIVTPYRGPLTHVVNAYAKCRSVLAYLAGKEQQPRKPLLPEYLAQMKTLARPRER